MKIQERIIWVMIVALAIEIMAWPYINYAYNNTLIGRNWGLLLFLNPLLSSVMVMFWGVFTANNSTNERTVTIGGEIKKYIVLLMVLLFILTISIIYIILKEVIFK